VPRGWTSVQSLLFTVPFDERSEQTARMRDASSPSRVTLSSIILFTVHYSEFTVHFFREGEYASYEQGHASVSSTRVAQGA
jgi:hypothetical protein